MPIDYRSLIADRKAKQTRPIVRHPVCLQPELYADLEEAQESLDAAELAEIDDDARAGGKAPSAALQAARDAVAEVEARIAEVTITAVFKAPTSQRQGQWSDEVTRTLEEAKDRLNEVVVEQAKHYLLETFDHFEGPGKERLDLNKADFEELLDQMAHGEALTISKRLANASSEDVDVPFSVRQSLGARHSVETSKPRSNSD